MAKIVNTLRHFGLHELEELGSGFQGLSLGLQELLQG